MEVFKLSLQPLAGRLDLEQLGVSLIELVLHGGLDIVERAIELGGRGGDCRKLVRQLTLVIFTRGACFGELGGDLLGLGLGGRDRFGLSLERRGGCCELNGQALGFTLRIGELGALALGRGLQGRELGGGGRERRRQALGFTLRLGQLGALGR